MALGQGQVPQFDVISVKPNHSGFRTPGVFRFLPDGSLRVVNMPLRDIIRVAYKLQNYQMDGWPSWLSSEFFDVQAKASGNPNDDARRMMLRSMLQSRFRFSAHIYSRRGDSYEMKLARPDRKTPAALKPSTADCAALRIKLPPNPLPPPPNAPLVICGIRDVPGRVFALGVPLDNLAATLANIVGRPVIDNTQLGGNFDLDVHYTPDPMPSPSALPPDSSPIDPNGPFIFTALREQLGLTLVARTAPVEVLAIDHAERPLPD
jgi:uncharacterized protein (TIGR03435 family)